MWVAVIAVVGLVLLQLVPRLAARRAIGTRVPELEPFLSAEQKRASRLLVYFWSPTCARCRPMSKAIDAVGSGDIVRINVLEALPLAQAFHEALELDGVIMTKLDGDARGGAALSVKSVTGVPIKFIGTGEQIEALEDFHPERLAGRILGMGDVVSLVEEAQRKFDQDEMQKQEERLKAGEFTLDDFKKMLLQTRRLGPLGKVLGMIPGMSKLKGMPGVDDKRMKHVEAIILSMTPKERSRPELLNGSRRKRIARGAGRPVVEINQLLKQFEMMRKLMKNKGAMAQMAGGLFGGGGMPQLPKGLMPGGGKMPKLPKGFRF
jgi:signal recognition particle subunit SRP54